MYTAIDYIRWRGGISLEACPFNEVDYYVLCKLCCLDLQGIVPPPGGGEGVTVKYAVDSFFEIHRGERVNLGALVAKEVIIACRLMADAPRFRDMKVYAYANNIDETKEEQFCALTIEPGDGTLYITFRGTDDTIVAWKENFKMSYCDEVPAQHDAARYLTRTASGSAKPIRVGGHSKGGNLSVYAAMKCPKDIQDRIIEIYNFDGPGFGKSVVQEPAYQCIRDRITTLLPQTPVVGVLMEHEESFEVTKSEAFGPFQHNGFRWEVEGPSFVRLGSVSGGGRYLNDRLGEWVDSVDMEQRRIFVNTLFDVLQSTGAKTLTELSDAKLRSARTIIRTTRGLDPETRAVLIRTIWLLMKLLVTFKRSSKSQECAAC
mgnify:FL=1